MAKPRQHRASSASSTPRSQASSCATGSVNVRAVVWPGRWRVLATVLILLHLAAVVLAPLAVEPSGDSRLWQAIATPFWPYIQAADLNHGYRFFGPEPGPSHLIRYHLEMPDGTTRDDVFPNLKEERPRLLYHRYFMLTEHLEGLYEQQMGPRPGGPPGLPEDSPQRREAERVYRAMVRSYADELLRRTGAARVHMELIEHDMPSPEESLQGMRLDDPSLYRTVDDLGTFAAATASVSEATPTRSVSEGAPERTP